MKLKNWSMEPFQVLISKAEYARKIFGGHFPTEHNGVADYKVCSVWIIEVAVQELVCYGFSFIATRAKWI